MPAFIFCCMRPTMNWLVSKYRAAHWLMQLASLELSDDPGFLMHISKHWSLRRLMACLRIAFFATTAGKNNHRNTQQQRKGEKKEYTMSNFWWTRKKKLYIYNVPVAPAGWSFEAVLVMIRTTCLGGEERWSKWRSMWCGVVTWPDQGDEAGRRTLNKKHPTKSFATG